MSHCTRVIDWHTLTSFLASINWDIVSSLAATVATFLAAIGIGLAWHATSISRQSTHINRRTYLDQIFDNLMNRMDAFEAASQPYWEHVPTKSELLDPDLKKDVAREQYQVLHAAVLGARSAIHRVGSSGLGELDATVDGQLDLDAALTLLDAAFWTSYFFSLSHSKAEAENLLARPNEGAIQSWDGAWSEVQSQLRRERPFVVAGNELALAREWAEASYPSNKQSGRAQLADAVLAGAKRLVRDRYRVVASTSAPWHSAEPKQTAKSLKESLGTPAALPQPV